jgi:hypothetical protein
LPEFGAAAAIALGALLVFSAAAKILHPTGAAQALEAGLDLPVRLAQAGAGIGIACEFAVATAITVWPDAEEAQAGVLGLFLLFGVLGGTALLRGRRVACNCFGAVHQSALGWAQLRLLVLAGLGVLVIHNWTPHWQPRAGIGALLVSECIACAALLGSLAPVWRHIRRDRVSLGSVRAHLIQEDAPMAAHDSERIRRGRT